MDAIFNIVFSLLAWLSEATGLSYEAVNVIAYYFAVPLVFLFLLDRIIKKHVFAPVYFAVCCFVLIAVRNFDDFADKVFDRSVDFLNAFAAIGWNYTVASVLICVVAPALIFVTLLYHAFPKLFRKDVTSTGTAGR